MSHHRLPDWRQHLIIGFCLAFLLTMTVAPTNLVHAQESPLPTPTSGQAPSPLASPTPGDTPTSPLPTPVEASQPSQPLSSTAATTTAPSSLAGMALSGTGTLTVIVLVALVVVGGVVWRRQRRR